MNRTEYKNNFGREHYERINLVVPKGMKDIIKALASSKGMSVNAYMQDLVRKDQCGLFDTMQIAEKNREMISGITGNMHDGYDIISRTVIPAIAGRKRMSGHVSLNTATKKAIDSSFFIAKCVLHKTCNVLHKTVFSVLVTC